MSSQLLRITLKPYIQVRTSNCESSKPTVLPVSDNLLVWFFKGDIVILVESAKNATSASNFTVNNIATRLKNISQEVDKMEPRKWQAAILNDADQMGECVVNRVSPQEDLY